jgi:20S proteasome subunit alpha 2
LFWNLLFTYSLKAFAAFQNKTNKMGDMNFSLTTFNKTGKLMQIEYALARVAQGKMALGIKATNGVVIASDRKVSSVLVDADEYQKIQSITPSTGDPTK